MWWNYYKLRQLSLLQSAMDSCYKLRQLFYYKVRHGLLQIATGITKCNGFITNCDRYYKVRWILQIATVQWLSLLTCESLWPCGCNFWSIFASIWSQLVTDCDISWWCSCILSSTWISAMQLTTDNNKADLQHNLSIFFCSLCLFGSFLTFFHG